MQGMTDWMRVNTAKKIGEYGKQKYWKKKEYTIEEII